MKFLVVLEDDFSHRLQPVDQVRISNAARQFDICHSAALVLQKLQTTVAVNGDEVAEVAVPVVAPGAPLNAESAGRPN